MIIKLLLVFFSFNLIASQDIALKEKELYLLISKAIHVEELTPGFFKQKRPPEVWFPLYRFHVLNRKSKIEELDLIIKKSLKKKATGTIRVKKGNRVILEMKSLRKLNITLHKDNLLLKYISFKEGFKEEPRQLSISLYNLVQITNEKGLPYTIGIERKMFAPYVKSSKIKGVRVYDALKLEARIKTLKDNELCHEVGPRCISKSKNTCDQCANGYYEVVSKYCETGGNKYCGRSECGGINQVACLRGNISNEQIQDGRCFSESVSGFCNQGLSTHCNDKGILVCL